MLSYIPRIFQMIQQKYELPKYKSMNVNELRERLAEIVPIEEIEELYERFADAGNVTIHLFKFKG